MPRKQQHTFTKSQIEKVHRMKAEGYSQADVAEAVGLKISSQLNWYIRTGALGNVPKRQGHRSINNTQTTKLLVSYSVNANKTGNVALKAYRQAGHQMKNSAGKKE